MLSARVSVWATVKAVTCCRIGFSRRESRKMPSTKRMWSGPSGTMWVKPSVRYCRTTSERVGGTAAFASEKGGLVAPASSHCQTELSSPSIRRTSGKVPSRHLLLEVEGPRAGGDRAGEAEGGPAGRLVGGRRRDRQLRLDGGAVEGDRGAVREVAQELAELPVDLRRQAGDRSVARRPLRRSPCRPARGGRGRPGCRSGRCRPSGRWRRSGSSPTRGRGRRPPAGSGGRRGGGGEGSSSGASGRSLLRRYGARAVGG